MKKYEREKLNMLNNLAKKFDQEDLETAVSSMLDHGEGIAASVYCVFKSTGFFGGSFVGGYASVTGAARLICIKSYISRTEKNIYDLNDLTRAKVTSAGFGQKRVRLEFGGDRKHPVIMQIAGRVVGSGFPDQSINRERLIDELTARAPAK